MRPPSPLQQRVVIIINIVGERIIGSLYELAGLLGEGKGAAARNHIRRTSAFVSAKIELFIDYKPQKHSTCFDAMKPKDALRHDPTKGRESIGQIVLEAATRLVRLEEPGLAPGHRDERLASRRTLPPA